MAKISSSNMTLIRKGETEVEVGSKAAQIGNMKDKQLCIKPIHPFSLPVCPGRTAEAPVFISSGNRIKVGARPV